MIRRFFDSLADQCVYFGVSYWYSRSNRDKVPLACLSDAMDLAKDTLEIAKGNRKPVFVDQANDKPH